MLTVRPCDHSDSRELWAWRNDPVTRAASLNSEPVAWDVHSRWFDRVITDDRRAIFIGELDWPPLEKIGMCRFDIELGNAAAEVSINLNPSHRGKRLSLPLLVNCMVAFQREHASITVLTAQIRTSNTASEKLFTSAGFKKMMSVDDVAQYSMSLEGWRPQQSGL